MKNSIVRFLFRVFSSQSVNLYPRNHITQRELEEAQYTASLKIYFQKSKEWKALFGDLSIDQAIRLMERIKQIQDTKRNIARK